MQNLLNDADVRPATFSQWKTTTRAPQPRLVNALADAINRAAQAAGSELYLDPQEARRLAGFLPEQPAATVDDVRRAIKANPNFTRSQSAALLQIIDGFEAQNTQAAGQQQSERSSPRAPAKSSGDAE
ncbi:hypothetical protein [Actinoplanes sp. NPDC049118]|uniref:hypothetical protein n=1 Tax=Actinoplanes sp. NPDC049118 TaxID=3155769 RepID=UPI0033EA9C5D